MDIEQELTKSLKFAGSGLEVAGLLLLFFNPFIFFVVDKSFSPISLFILISSAALGLVFIMLGWKIHKNVYTAKWRLLVALILAVLFLVLSLANGPTGDSALYLGIVIASSLIGLDAVKKLKNPSLHIKEIEAQNLKGIDKAKDVLKMIIIAIIVIGLFIGIGYVVSRFST